MSTIAYIQTPSTFQDSDPLQQIEEAAKQLSICLNWIRNQNSFNAFYDGDSFRALANNAEEFQEFLESNSTHLDIMECFNHAQNWQDDRFQKSDCRYMLWEYNTGCTEVTGACISELAERKLLAHASRLVFINLGAIKTTRSFLPVFKDALHLPTLPQFINIEHIRDKEELELWFHSHSPDFSLTDQKYFERTNYIWPSSGQRIYREIATQHYWYFDFYHKTHYEVFDSTGKRHLGEADLSGILDTQKSSLTKKIDNLIA
jgi:hypothetical protein